MVDSLSKEEVLERLWKVGRIVLLIAIVALLIALIPTMKTWIADLFYKSMQSRIRITPSTITEWARPDAVEVFSRELLECGFAEIGDFMINQSKRVKIRAYLQPEKNIYATIYDSYGKPALLDFYIFYEDGSSLLMTTAPNPHKSKPPGKQIWYIEEAMSIRDLYDKMLGNRSDKPVRQVSKEGFAPALEQYKEEMSLWEAKEFMR